jgi:hypothetical protein
MHGRLLAGHVRQANGGNETRGERMSRLIITTTMTVDGVIDGFESRSRRDP